MIIIVANKFTEFSILDIARRCGIWVKDNGNTEVKARCPFCGGQKSKPTASINTDKNVFYCHRCGEGLNSVSLYGKIVGADNKSAYRELVSMNDVA